MRLLKPLGYQKAQVSGAVKAAVGEAKAGALTGADSCATSSGSPEFPLFFGDDNQLRRNV